MEVYSWENHLFPWAIYTMAMLNNQMVVSQSIFGAKSWIGVENEMTFPFVNPPFGESSSLYFFITPLGRDISKVFREIEVTRRLFSCGGL